MKTRLALLHRIAITLLSIAAAAQAVAISVTNTNDSGPDSLRQAIADASPGDTITFSLPANSVITLTSNQLLIDKELTIIGPGADQLTITRANSDTNIFVIFRISAYVTLSGVTITNGSSTGDGSGGGGGIVVVTFGNLTLSNSIVSGNTAGQRGGGILNLNGGVEVINSTIAGNSAGSSGGGIYNDGGLSVRNSTIAGNSCPNGSGGGLFNTAGADISNTTISGNGRSGAPSVGGGVFNSGALYLTNSTVTDNEAVSEGGGIFSDSAGTASARNTIIARNSAPAGPDVDGTVTSGGYTLLGDTAGATINKGVGDRVNVNPLLGPLQNNGGPTETHALLSGSPAIDIGDSSDFGTDQRGLARPVDSPTVSNADGVDGSDIGAYEVQADILPGCSNVDRVVRNAGNSGTGSLRGVLAAVCAGSTITFADDVRGAITLTSESLLINKSLSINGPGADLLSVQRSSAGDTPNFGIFYIALGTYQVSISGLTISNGFAEDGSGGGIYTQASNLALSHSRIVGNSASIGGGIQNDFGGTLNITSSTISGNIADSGGGIGNGGTVHVTNSTISGNQATIGSGGGISQVEGKVHVTNSTISGNTAPSGGGIYAREFSLTNSTITGNSASEGGGILRPTGSPRAPTARNTIIALNSAATGPDYSGFLLSLNFNLIGNSEGATIGSAQFSDQIGTPGATIDPLLGLLQDNGGPTFTHALDSGSPAIDKGHSSDATTDQRGFTRPVGIASAIDGDGGDIGAFEVQPPPPTPSPTPPTTPTATPSATPTATPTPTIGATATPTATPSATPTATPTPTIGATATPTATIGATVTPTATVPPPTPPSSPSPTSTPRVTPSATPTATATVTPSATPRVTPSATPTASPAPSPTTQAINLSTRMRVQTGDRVGIAGFIITGSAPKQVLLRAIGPSLSRFDVPNFLADPVLELHGPAGFATVINDNWRDAQETAITATGIPPTDNAESAILATLSPGAYTGIVKGKDNTAGVALIEVYDLDQGGDSKLANLSTRAFISTGSDIAIAGFFLSDGNASDRIVVRGLGPSLAPEAFPASAVLADPTLELRDANGVLLSTNNDWRDNPAQAAIITAAGLEPTRNLEAAISATLPPGVYTALLAGLDNGTGIGLVEVYDRGP